MCAGNLLKLKRTDLFVMATNNKNVVVLGVDVWRLIRNHSMLACGTHIPQAQSLLLEIRSQRS